MQIRYICQTRFVSLKVGKIVFTQWHSYTEHFELNAHAMYCPLYLSWTHSGLVSPCVLAVRIAMLPSRGPNKQRRTSEFHSSLVGFLQNCFLDNVLKALTCTTGGNLFSLTLFVRQNISDSECYGTVQLHYKAAFPEADLLCYSQTTSNSALTSTVINYSRHQEDTSCVFLRIYHQISS